MTQTPHGPSIPWTVKAGDGRAVAGHVPSKEIAQRLADALNFAAALDLSGETTKAVIKKARAAPPVMIPADHPCYCWRQQRTPSHRCKPLCDDWPGRVAS